MGVVAVAPGARRLQPRQPRPLRQLALLPDVGGEHRRDPADDRRVRRGDRPPVPAGGASADEQPSRSRGCGPTGCASGRSARCRREAAPRPPAGLRGLVDLRLRRRHDRGAGRGRRLGRDPRPQGTGVVARLRRRALLQQHPSVGRGALLLRHGHPPVGQVLHGRLARRARRGPG